MSRRASLLHRVGRASSEIGRRPPQRRSVKFAVGIGLPLLVFGFLIYTVASQWSDLSNYDIHFRAGWLAPAVALHAVWYVYGAQGWDFVLRLLGHRLAPIRAQTIWGQSILARYVPGSLLLVLGRVVLSEREGVPRRTAFASFVYEVGLTFAAAVMVGAYFFVTHPDLSGNPWRWAVGLVIPAALVCLHPRVFRRLGDAGLRRLGRDPLPAVMPFRGVLAMLFYYTGYWLLVGSAAFCVARSIFPVHLSDLPVLVAAQALAFCVAVLALVFPAGLGIKDGAYAWAIKVALPDSSFVLAAAIAVASRVVQTLVEVSYVGSVTLLDRRSASRRASRAPAGEPAG